MDHSDVLSALLGLTTARSVHLVARTTIRNARVTEGRVWVFVPDLHLLTRRSAAEYKYSFGHNGTRRVEREALLQEVCTALARLQTGTGRTLFVFQLGDFVDVWRENQIREVEDLASLSRRVLADNPAARDYLADATRLGTSLVIGNHDHVGTKSLARDDTFVRMKVSLALPPDGSVVVTHGDLFDPTEKLPDPWSRWGSRFTRVIGPGTKDLPGAKRIRKLEDVPTRLGVTSKHQLFPGAIDFARGLRRGDVATLRRLRLRSKRPVKIFVIGHTHHARLALKQGVVLLDCGAWLERCRIDGRVLPCCQLGVIAQTGRGTDLRLYQLTPA